MKFGKMNFAAILLLTASTIMTGSSDPDPNPVAAISAGKEDVAGEKPSGTDYSNTTLLKELNVQIKSHYQNGVAKGSGVCLDKRTIVANYHVVYPTRGKLNKIVVKNLKGQTANVESIVVTKLENDLAVLKLEKDLCETWVLPQDILSLKPTVTDVIHVGNPSNLDWQVRSGRMDPPISLKSLSNSILERIDWISADTMVAQTTIDTTHGSSGGGVYSKDGLVGILFAGGTFNGKQEVLVISAALLKEMREDLDTVSFKKMQKANINKNFLSIQVNYETTHFLLSPRYDMDKPNGVSASSLMKPDLFTEPLFNTAMQSKMRMIQFYNFNPNVTAVVIFSDRNGDGKTDLMLILGVPGILKELPEQLSFNQVRDAGYLILSDSDYDGWINEASAHKM